MAGLIGVPAALVRSRRQLLKAGAAALLPLPLRGGAQAACRPTVTDSSLLPVSSGRVLRIAPDDPLLSFAATSRAARDGDTIEVEPGDYSGDVASWTQSDLTIRGVAARPRLLAQGHSAEDKAIFVLKGRRVRIENLEFRGARVRDRNGAGIRVEGGPLTISGCAFIDNENGILAGNNESMEIAIDSSSFDGNGNAEGSAHNLYVGTIGALTIDGSWFARARTGHLLKSRARLNTIQYCRLTGEEGTASYELEFPNGGSALVLGNLIQQGPASENQTIVSYGAEGYRWPTNALTMAFNTVVNDRPNGGVRVRVAAGAAGVKLAHNLWLGAGTLSIDAPLEAFGNREAVRRDFADPGKFDFRLRAGSSLAGQAGFRGRSSADLPLPLREYVHEASSCPLEGLTSLTPLSPGAFQRLA